MAEASLDEESFRCRMLQQEVENAGRRVEALETDITHLRSEKNRITESATSASRECEDLRASMSIMASERDSTRSTVESLRREVERLQTELQLRSRQSTVQPVTRLVTVEVHVYPPHPPYALLSSWQCHNIISRQHVEHRGISGRYFCVEQRRGDARAGEGAAPDARSSVEL